MDVIIDGGESLELRAFKSVKFKNWVTQLRRIWSDVAEDVPELHGELRTDLQSRLRELRSAPAEREDSELGLVYVGAGGSGKTHFLSFVRRAALDLGLNFVLVDMTDVRDFWSTVALAFADSLGRYADRRRTQLQLTLENLVNLALPELNGEEYVDSVARVEPSILDRALAEIMTGLQRCGHCSPMNLQAHRNVIRALFALNSTYFESTSSVGYAWLQGVSPDDSDPSQFSVGPAQERSAIVKGVSWVLSLRAPSVVVFDQLDAIVAQYNLAAGDSDAVERKEEQQKALAIIEGIVGGLSAIVDQATRTLPIVTCINNTWMSLTERGLASHKDRFEDPAILRPIANAGVAKSLVESRLLPAYREAHFTPPYSSWPFRYEFFASLAGAFPRQILQICADHQKRCISEGRVIELPEPSADLAGTFFPEKNAPTGAERQPEPPEIPAAFAHFDQILAEARPEPALLDEEHEDQLGELVLRGCELLLKEASTPPDVDLLLDGDFTGNRRFPSLHARVRTVFHNEGDREEHICLRVLQKTNAQAYKARVSAAMTAAGIDRGLSFRKLFVVRTTPHPTTPKMSQLTDDFKKRGGELVDLSAEDAGTLKNIVNLARQRAANFDDWLRLRRPISKLSLFARILPQYLPPDDSAGNEGRYRNPGGARFKGAEPSRAGSGKDTSKTKLDPAPADVLVTKPPEAIAASSASAATQQNPAAPKQFDEAALIIGRRIVGGRPDSIVALDPQSLSKHTVIRAGSGGGKTVLVKRLIEEAALCGIPSIVIDPANDLAQLGDPWPAEPESWLAGDAERARRYHATTDVVVWTPGRSAGRPLQLAPLPNMEEAADDEDEMNMAVAMATGALEQYVATGSGEKAKLKRGVLSAALHYFGRNRGAGLDGLIELLSDLPSEAGAGINGSQKLAASMADSLRAAVQVDPLLQSGAQAIDPTVLFGLNDKSRTRVSVISLIGLPTLSAQQNFVNQLAMALFSWIKKHPSVGAHGMTGLFVIDEAKDFLPSVHSAPSKQSLMLLAAQARKYGLGLILATQNPIDLDYKAVAQFSTQFFGKANSPQVIDFIRKQIAEKGGSAEDIGRLQKGQFYLLSENAQQPFEIAASMCLSHHPDRKPLTEEEVLNKARAANPD